MRHGKRFNHLGRTAPHRKAMLSNMASSLILHKRITTTVAKAKALRPYIEPLLTRAKEDTTHSRRVVFSYLQNKESVRELFDTVSEKINERPGGYTRIIKTGTRLGDSAEMCIIELVDYNELLLEEGDARKTKTRRGSRRKKKSTSEAAATAPTIAKAEEAKASSEEVKEEAPEDSAEDSKAAAGDTAVAGEGAQAAEEQVEEKDTEEKDTEEKDTEEVKASAQKDEPAEEPLAKEDDSEKDSPEDASSEEEKKE